MPNPKMLSRPALEAAIRAGGVVQMPNGITIHRVEDLPTEADLAIHEGSDTSQAMAERALLEKKAAIDAELSKLQAAKRSEVVEGAARQRSDIEAKADGDKPAPEPKKGR